MCLNNGNNNLPVAQAVAPAPTKEGVTVSTDPTTVANQSKAVIQKRQGIFGNIKTTPMGDASYGTFASFGKRAA